MAGDLADIVSDTSGRNELTPEGELLFYTVLHTQLYGPAPRDPLEVLWDLIHKAQALRTEGRQPLGWVREELQFLVNQMCPFDGRVTQHEDAEHRFVPAAR